MNSMSKIVEIFNPDLKIGVRYKLLSEHEVNTFISVFQTDDPDQYDKAILENVIFNLKTITHCLSSLPHEQGIEVLDSIFCGCLMLNPSLDPDSWRQISQSPHRISKIGQRSTTKTVKSVKSHPISKEKYITLENHLKSKIIGQDEAIETVCNALKRAQVGLNDENRPLGVFLLGGPSGVGKTTLAKELQNHLFPGAELVRVNCGEYQHKHENQKLLGSSPGYLGYEEGGQLTNALLKNPYTVVLLDEVEKAHRDIWDTFLNVFDDGYLVSGSGQKASFRDALILMTTNLGNDTYVSEMTDNVISFVKRPYVPQRSRMVETAQRSIKKAFRPEFINRMDDIIIFNQLTHENYLQIAELELKAVNVKLAKKGCMINYTDQVLENMVIQSCNPVQGARGLSRFRRERIENKLADLILQGRTTKGVIYKLTPDFEIVRTLKRAPRVTI